MHRTRLPFSGKIAAILRRDCGAQPKARSPAPRKHLKSCISPKNISDIFYFKTSKIKDLALRRFGGRQLKNHAFRPIANRFQAFSHSQIWQNSDKPRFPIGERSEMRPNQGRLASRAALYGALVFPPKFR